MVFVLAYLAFQLEILIKLRKVYPRNSPCIFMYINTNPSISGEVPERKRRRKRNEGSDMFVNCFSILVLCMLLLLLVGDVLFMATLQILLLRSI